MVYCEAKFGQIFQDIPKHDDLIDVGGKINKYLVCIAGPTGVGKTSLAIRLAQQLHTEIISADSRQIYRQMSVGTAKPTHEELSSARHHLIDYLDLSETFSAGDFERETLNILSSLFKSHHSAIMCGGTGLYHKAVLEGLDVFPDVPKEIRQKWEALYEREGIEPLQMALQSSDHQYYKSVDLNNSTRLIRALSVIESAGKPFSSYHRSQLAQRDFIPIRIFLNTERQTLYDRINARVDQMLANGLEQEVRSLLPWRKAQALQTVGYKEFFEYFDGNWSLDHTIEKIKQHSRNYAKRQITWFRNQGDWTEFEMGVGGEEKIFKYISDLTR